MDPDKTDEIVELIGAFAESLLINKKLPSMTYKESVMDDRLREILWSDSYRRTNFDPEAVLAALLLVGNFKGMNGTYNTCVKKVEKFCDEQNERRKIGVRSNARTRQD